jgi:hypothetical protein
MQNFIDTYINLNLKDFQSFGFDLPITKLLGAVFLGIMVAAVIMNIIKQNNALVLKALLRHECRDEESARTLGELRITSRFARFAVFSDYGRLRRIITRVGETQKTYEELVQMQKEKKKPEKLDRETTKLYLPDSKRDEAKRILERGTPSTLDSVLICVLLTALYICFIFIMPSVISFLNSIL